MAEYIVAGLGSRPLVEATAAEIAALLEQVGAEVSPTVATQVLGTLKEPFADAADDGTIARRPGLTRLCAASRPVHP